MRSESTRLKQIPSRGSSPFAVQLEHVSKQYTLDAAKPLTMRDMLKPRRFMRQITGKRPFTALKDVTLQVPHGQILGIIGPNGSGKSSLLRVLAGISPPTTGTVMIDGSYGALLELGAGFHPAVSGRQNAYVNALFMGMSKEEAINAMPSIIDFSGLGDFIDQPMRTYSSGMFLRLGFSVAIHVRPDILLVDEVLAVGDAAFQEKCFDHFKSLRKQNTTVILVTHGIDSLVDFADRVIMLQHGEVKFDGDPVEVIGEYMKVLSNDNPLMQKALRRGMAGNLVERALRENLSAEQLNEMLAPLRKGAQAQELAESAQ